MMQYGTLNITDNNKEKTIGQIQSLDREQIRTLEKGQIKELSKEQIQSLSGKQINALIPEQIKIIDTFKFTAFNKEQIQALTKEQLIQIAPYKLCLLTEEQLGYLTEKQLNTLNKKQVRLIIEKLKPKQYEFLSETAINNNINKIKRLSKERYNELVKYNKLSGISKEQRFAIKIYRLVMYKNIKVSGKINSQNIISLYYKKNKI